MRNLQKSVMLITIAAVTSHCGKKDDDSSSGAVVEEETVASGEQPDSEAGRYTRPIDTTPPLVPSAFAVAGGAQLGDVLVMLGYPEKIDDYARIDIRRAAGTVAPADCDSGTLVSTITDFSQQSWTDSGLYPGSFHSYLACIYDATGNVIKTESLSKGRATDRQRIFATSAKYDGNLKATFQGATFTTGTAGADARCQWHADQAKLGGSWRAVIGDAGMSNLSHVPIFGGLYNLKNERIAANLSQLWGASNENAVNYDETGTVIDDIDGDPVYGYVWTGLLSDGKGDLQYNCNNWSSTAGAGRLGNSSEGSDIDYYYRWISQYIDSCTSEHHLYCAEYVGEEFPTPTVTTTASATVGLVDVSLDFSTVSQNMHRLAVYREAGSNFTNFDCSSTYGNRFGVAKIYSNTGTTALADDSFQDDIDTEYPYNDNAAGEHGYYHYYACTYDSYGNVNSISAIANVTVGTTWLRSFLSDNTFTGSTASQAGANTECTNTAAAHSVTGTFKAFFSDETVDASVNVGTTNARLIFDLNKNYVGASSTGYMDVSNSVKTFGDASEAPLGTKSWTGSSYYGTSYSTCTDWSTNSSGSYGTIMQDVGRPTNYSSYTAGCDSLLPVVCFEAN